LNNPLSRISLQIGSNVIQLVTRLKNHSFPYFFHYISFDRIKKCLLVIMQLDLY